MIKDAALEGHARSRHLSSKASSRSKKIYPLTSLRFFAAFLVVFHHTAHAFLPAFSGMTVEMVPRGFVDRLLFSVNGSVSFFFLLSGYVLSVAYLRDGQKVKAGDFFAARFARIYPLFFVILILATPTTVLTLVHRYGVPAGLARAIAIFFSHVLLMQAWYPTQLVTGVDAPSWSLCCEVFFYLCFPVLGVWLWRLRGLRLWLMAVVFYGGGQALVWLMRPHLNQRTVLFWPPLHLSTFALGVLLARWQRLQQERNEGSGIRAWQVNIVLGLSAIGVLLSALLVSHLHVKEPYSNGLLAPIFAGVIWSVSARPSRLSRWLCAKWLVALGNGSYALYLINIPLLILFQSLHLATQALYPVYLVLCVGLSMLSFYYFETPLRLWLLERFKTRSIETMVEASVAQ
jgi:peptidoglycan/LPS O-acetylase OafA/YrhL